MLNDAPSIIVHLTDSVKCTHKREIIKKNAVTVTHNAQEYMELGVTPVFESRDGTSGTTCLLVKCFCDISCIRLKFSREFVASTANTRRGTANTRRGIANTRRDIANTRRGIACRNVWRSGVAAVAFSTLLVR